MKPRNIVENMRKYNAKSYDKYVRLNANESSSAIECTVTTALNRYPDSDALALRRAIGNYVGVDKDNIVVGNGSSEMIELILKTYLNPGDGVMSFTPTFGMYKVFTELYNGVFMPVETQDCILDVNQLIKEANEKQPKVIMICNPNNPTGAILSKCDIEKVLKTVNAIVVVDEAYIEFGGESLVNRFQEYEQLIVLRTFSKAWGLAGARVGYLISGDQVIKAVDKVKSPYNLNALSQAMVVNVLNNKDQLYDTLARVKKERERVFKALINSGYKVYKSYGNFLYFYGEADLGQLLMNRNVVIRDFANGTYRVTIGTEKENNCFIDAVEGLERKIV